MRNEIVYQTNTFTEASLQEYEARRLNLFKSATTENKKAKEFFMLGGGIFAIHIGINWWRCRNFKNGWKNAFRLRNVKTNPNM